MNGSVVSVRQMAHSSAPLRVDMATGKVLAHKCKWGIGGEHESLSLSFVFEFTDG